jgi:DNA-binding transcriptional ArsR family regulator
MGWITELPEGYSIDRSHLTSHPVAGITTLLQALADPLRLDLVRDLAASAEPRPCGSLIQSVTKSTLSHHLRVLREAGLIEHRLDGTRKLTSLRRAEIDAAYPGLLDSVLRAPVGEPAAAL